MNALEATLTSSDLEPPVIGPAALLRGSAKGLEIHVDGRHTLAEISQLLVERLAEAPSFWRGSDVRIKIDHGPLPGGALAKLDEIATSFELRIVEVGALTPPVAPPRRAATASTSPAPVEDAVPVVPTLAAGSAPAAAEVAAAEPVVAVAPAPVEAASAPIITIEDDRAAETSTTRVVVGPVRSGVILDHPGHLIVFGDVNPGAEVRAEGNIVVLGRLRGTAHAGIGNNSGFILALRLEPQQLRICRQVARAGDSDAPVNDAEIAYVTDASIVVERYAGRLPKNLAASI